MGTPEAITLTPEVDYQGFPNANGIRVTPDGKYVIFADTNDGKLYRMVPSEVPTEREISEIGVRGRTDSPDGLELHRRFQTLCETRPLSDFVELRIRKRIKGARGVNVAPALSLSAPIDERDGEKRRRDNIAAPLGRIL